MRELLIVAIRRFSDILVMLLLARAVMSWFIHSADSPGAGIYKIVIDLTEPIVAPIRKLMANVNTGMLDFSVLVAFFAIRFTAMMLIRLVSLLF